MNAETSHRFGTVAILGRPNVGKSTLMNRLLGQKLAITTSKPQTTRDRIRGIRTFDDWQVVWVDTPGIHEARSRLNRYMVELALATVADVDLCYVLVDAPRALGAKKPPRTAEGAPELAEAEPATDPAIEELKSIIEALQTTQKRAFLLLNKVDRVPDKAALFGLIERFKELYPFEEIIPISGKRGSNVDRLLALTRAALPEGAALFEADDLTDRPMRFIATEMIREQLFIHLAQELPYNLAVHVLSWEEKGEGLVVIHANVHVARKSHKPIVVGKGGAQIKLIGERSRLALERLLERKVYLDLRVKVDEDWTEREDKLKALGYDELE